MKNKQTLLKEFRELYDYIASIEKMELYKWELPLAKGEWTVKEAFAHIMRWDERYFKNGVERICRGQFPTIGEIDFELYNAKSRSYGSKSTNHRILNYTMYYRRELLVHLETIPEEDFSKSFNGFVLNEYLEDFIGHDRHHLEKIKKVIG
ncbi:MAG: hypothetical protein WBA54_05505 [Acidaminobacteraceae bacterium]